MDIFKGLHDDSLRHLRKTPETPPAVSVFDVIAACMGASARDCPQVWKRLQESHAEVLTECHDFQFAGRRQRPTPVASARGIAQIIMVLPGRTAAQFRKHSADVVVRFLGGDLSIVEEVVANRSLQEAAQQEHPMRFFGETVESDELNRKREAVQLAELDLQLQEIKGRAKRARVENVTASVRTGLACMRDLGLPIDDRARMRATDLIQQAVFEESRDTPGDPEICVREFLQSQGVRDASMDARVGKLAKQLLLRDRPEHTFRKKTIYCNGQLREANVWHRSDQGYLERALASLAAKDVA